MKSETICAISTPQGAGAMAVIRVSGSDALTIADKVFRSPRAGKRLAAQRGMTMHFGTVCDGDREIDQVVVGVFRAPHSFTGEDTAEITCHGSTVVQREVLAALIAAGARMARPGEFTQRAFLNGKMDLAQAEAVADLIASQSEGARRLALANLKGGVSERLGEMRQQLLQFTSLLELELDFSEEDVSFANRDELKSLVGELMRDMERLAATFSLGNAVKNGVLTAIVGAPNVGKSTLLNALLGEERAIVSDIQGTTRDAIEDTMSVGDMTFRFVDTAGIREGVDTIERMGIDRTFAHIGKAAIVVVLLAPEAGRAAAEETVAEVCRRMDTERQKMLVVMNKCDKGHAEWLTREWADAAGAWGFCEISAKEGIGMDDLRIRLLDMAHEGGEYDSETAIVSNARHYEALVNACAALRRVDEGLEIGLGSELIALDLHEALDYMGTITGEITTQETLNNIFSKFCIGK